MNRKERATVAQWLLGFAFVSAVYHLTYAHHPGIVAVSLVACCFCGTYLWAERDGG